MMVIGYPQILGNSIYIYIYIYGYWVPPNFRKLQISIFISISNVWVKQSTSPMLMVEKPSLDGKMLGMADPIVLLT